MFGQSIWGAFQDKIGRRKVLLICGNSLVIFLAIMIFAPNHYYFMVGSGLAGFFSSGLGAYTLPIELVSADKRFIVGTLITAGWATGAGWYLLSSFVMFPNIFSATVSFMRPTTHSDSTARSPAARPLINSEALSKNWKGSEVP